jgi:predicted small secreted protein
MARKVVFWAALVMLLVAVVGCQTVQGVGRDITAIGAFCEDVIEKD